MRKAYLVTFPNGDQIVFATPNGVLANIQDWMGKEAYDEFLNFIKSTKLKPFQKGKFIPYTQESNGYKIQMLQFIP